MTSDILEFNNSFGGDDMAISETLLREIDTNLPNAKSKIWHGHPVWFIEGNPIVGYNKLKECIRLLFWSGQSFDEDGLDRSGSFEAAEARYTDVDQINSSELKRWLTKSKDIHWDYKDIVKRKGEFRRLK